MSRYKVARGCDMATALPRYCQAVCDTACSARNWEQGHDTKICITLEGGDFGSQYDGTAL